MRQTFLDVSVATQKQKKIRGNIFLRIMDEDILYMIMLKSFQYITLQIWEKRSWQMICQKKRENEFISRSDEWNVRRQKRNTELWAEKAVRLYDQNHELLCLTTTAPRLEASVFPSLLYDNFRPSSRHECAWSSVLEHPMYNTLSSCVVLWCAVL